MFTVRELDVFTSRTLRQTQVTPGMTAAAHARFEDDGANAASL